MARLAISVLGMPRIEMGGSPLAVDRRKAVALLVYLATSEGVRSRDTLATLLWPGYDQATARGNLRRTLSVLHSALCEEWLLIDRETVALRRGDDLWVDVQQFERLLSECRTHGHAGDQVCARCLEPLTQTAALYRDDFLTGFTLADAPDFDDWQRDQTENLRSVLSGALERLTRCLASHGDFPAALTQARRRVALDPLDEAAQRQLMQVHAWAGDRSTALRQYQSCTELLRRDLSTTPAPETTALFEAISQNRLPAPVLFALPSAQAPLTTESSKQAPLPSQNDDGTQGELRPVTILCVGLAGETDPETAVTGVDRLLASLEMLLGHYEASLDRVLGDSVIAVFGARQLHEDDAERAIHAARALVEETYRQAGRRPATQVSVGVATGEAYFGPVGRAGQATHSVLGPLVNRAARLQGRATAGQVLADRATYGRTYQAFAYRTVGGDGESGQGQIREVTGALARPTKTRGIEGLRAALIGRDEQLTKLDDALARIQAGQGHMVALIGEAGVGKSRLVAELKARCDSLAAATRSRIGDQAALDNPQPAITWLEGRCLEMATSTSYGPFVDLLRGHFSAAAMTGDAPCDPALLACAIRDGLQGLQDEGRLTAEQVEEIGPLLGNLLSVIFGDDWDERLRMADPGQIRHRTFAALRAFFGALARRWPTVVVLEDLHWADSLSVDLIGELLGLLDDHPLLLLCVYRPGREYPSERLAAVAERRGRERYTEVRVRALTPDESRQLLASLLTVEGLPVKARELIVAQGEGNPFFTEEIVRGLIDAGLLYRDGATWRARERIEIAHAPEGVQAVILSRMDRLAPADRQVLQAASVLGRLFRLRVLARLIPSELNLDTTLDRLAERDFVYLERTWPEAEVSFKHVLTQEAVYGTLLANRKLRLHRQAGEAIEALYADSLAEHTEALAHHYDRGDAREKAVEYLLKAGEKARRAYLNDEAVGYFERALARCEQAAPAVGQVENCASSRLEALTGLGKVHFLIGRFVEAEGWLRQAISLARELGLAPVELVRLYFWLGEVLYGQGRQVEMIALGEESLALLGDTTESLEAITMNHFIAIGWRYAGYETRFWEHVQRIARSIERPPYSEELRSAYLTVAALHWIHDKELDEGRIWFDTLEEHSRRHHDLRASSEVLEARGNMEMRRGDYRAALLLLGKALEVCTQVGDVPIGRDVCFDLGWNNLRLGEIEAAEGWAHRVLESWVGVNDESRVPWALPVLGIVRLCEGDVEGASRLVGEIRDLLPRLSRPWQFDITLRLGEIYLALERRADALDLYTELFRKTQPATLCVWQRKLEVRPQFPDILSRLEEACGDSMVFRAICQSYQDRHPDAVTLSLPQWYLKPAETQPVQSDPRLAHEFAQESAERLLAAGWRSDDPFGDCSYVLQPGSGLALRAANGRDLFHINQSAPRFLRAASGDFVAEIVCLAADDRPAMGGLLLWLDMDNYLKVEWGRYGRREVLFEGCVTNVDADYGRGRLPGRPDKLYLRLARRGERVDALCSADGETWWSVGHAAFPADDPVQIGVCAIGMIDRTIYPGAYREGTAIRFESFRMW